MTTRDFEKGARIMTSHEVLAEMNFNKNDFAALQHHGIIFVRHDVDAIHHMMCRNKSACDECIYKKSGCAIRRKGLLGDKRFVLSYAVRRGKVLREGIIRCDNMTPREEGQSAYRRMRPNNESKFFRWFKEQNNLD